MTSVIKKEFASYALQVHRSHIHGWGVYASEPIPPGRKVIEYTGERVGLRQAVVRSRKIWRNPRAGLITLFRLNRRSWIDGAVGGSGAEYINHCCDPNLSVRRMKGHILLYSRRRIRSREELTLDYCLHPKKLRIPCRCGSADCRGTINLKS